MNDQESRTDAERQKTGVGHLHERKALDAGEPYTVTVRECCRLTSLGRTTVYALIGNGALEAVHVGSRTLILVHSIRNLLGLCNEEPDA